MIKQLTQYIESNVAGLTIGTNLFAGDIEIDKPDDCVLVLESVPATRNYVVPYLSRVPIQFMVRDTEYMKGRDTAETIHDLFVGREHTHILLSATASGESSYLVNSCTGNKPFSLGRDEKGRHLFSLNLTFHLEEQ